MNEPGSHIVVAGNLRVSTPQQPSQFARPSRGAGAAVAVLLGVLVSVVQAQSPVNLAALDTDFDPSANDEVLAMVVQPDEKIVVGGTFTTLNGQPRNRLGRLHPDGTLDASFVPGVEGYAHSCEVNSLALQADGKILLGGSFTALGGQPRTNLARLLADGTLDEAFTPQASGDVKSMVMQADGKILVAGSFTNLGGQTHKYLARLNADGTADAEFNPVLNSPAYSLALQADGKILVCGGFTLVGGQPRQYLARLNANGTLDFAFNPQPNVSVLAISVQADGKVLIGGYFTTLAGQPQRYFARLNADGSLDTDFNPAANAAGFTLAVQADGKILLGGTFTEVGGQPRSHLARVFADGTLDDQFELGAGSKVDALGLQTDGRILAGGLFTMLGGQPRNRIARLRNTQPYEQSLAYDGVNLTWQRSGSGPEIWRTTFECSSDGVTWSLLGNGFRVTGGWQLSEVVLPSGWMVRARGWVRGGYYNASGWYVEAYAGVPVVLTPPANRTNAAGTTATFTVRANGSEPVGYQWRKDGVALSDGGNIGGVQTSTLILSNILGGDMGGYSVVVTNGWGSVTSALATLTVIEPAITAQPVSQSKQPGESVTFSVSAVGSEPLSYQWHQDGVPLAQGTNAILELTNLQDHAIGNYTVVVSSIYGSVTSAPALLTINLAELDTGFDAAANNAVYSLAVQADGKILVGGYFTQMNGEPHNRVARLNADGTVDAQFNASAEGGGLPEVISLAVQNDGRILVGGYFTTLNGQPRNYLGRLNADGTLDEAFDPRADGYVESVVVQADGKILVGGRFSNMLGQPRSKLARLNADGTLDAEFSPQFNDSIHALALQTDGKILVGGYFSMVSGQGHYYLALLNPDGTSDSAFTVEADNPVRILAVQGDGKILVGGGFTQLGGQPRGSLGRLNADGTLDLQFDPGANSTVTSLALQADGKILVGGGFTELGGQPRRYLGRLQVDGTPDAGFGPEPAYYYKVYEYSSDVYAVALQADGKILVGGAFNTVAGQTRQRLVRLSNPTPANQSLTFDGDALTWLRGGASPEVWRTSFDLSTDGTTWSSLGSGSRVPDGWKLTGVQLPSGGTIRARGYVAGGLRNASSYFVEAYLGAPVVVVQPANRTNDAGTTATFSVLASGSGPLEYQWRKDGLPLLDGANINGAKTATLSVGNVLKADEGSYSVVVVSAQGSITSDAATLTVIEPAIITQPLGQHRSVGETVTFNVSAAGTAPRYYQWLKDSVPLAQATAAVLKMTNLQPAETGWYSVVVTNQYGSVTSAVAQLIVDLTVLDSAFDPGADNIVYSLAVQPDGRILVGGAFTTLGSQPRAALARLNPDGAMDSTFNPELGGVVFSLVVQPDGKILVGGWFPPMSEDQTVCLIRVSADGAFDEGFQVTSTDGAVNNMALQPDGKIVVGGDFSILNGQPHQSLARLNADGTLDSDFQTAANAQVRSLALQIDGKILAAGSFTEVDGQLRRGIVRLNANGTVDSEFDPDANSSLRAVAVQPDGRILVGGYFTELAGEPRSRIARLNADGTLDMGFNPGADEPVYSLSAQTDGKILAGGYFVSLGGQARRRIGRLNADGTLDATFNPEVENVNSSCYVYALAVQAGGEVLVGGQFDTVAGQLRKFLARLQNTEPANQSLTRDGSTVTWQRSGTSPEVWQTTFEYSTEGFNWISLGAGTRVAGGWQCPDGGIPENAFVRARGFVVGSGEAQWFVESRLPAFPQTAPKILMNDGSFGLGEDGFGFDVGGTDGQLVIVESSSDLVHWTTLSTNTVSGGSFRFTASDWHGTAERFYRAKLWP